MMMSSSKVRRHEQVVIGIFPRSDGVFSKKKEIRGPWMRDQQVVSIGGVKLKVWSHKHVDIGFVLDRMVSIQKVVVHGGFNLISGT